MMIAGPGGSVVVALVRSHFQAYDISLDNLYFPFPTIIPNNVSEKTRKKIVKKPSAP